MAGWPVWNVIVTGRRSGESAIVEAIQAARGDLGQLGALDALSPYVTRPTTGPDRLRPDGDPSGVEAVAPVPYAGL